jgi:hypothetical protein
MKKNTTKNNMSLIQILLIVFIILKLTHNIDWSWWWVLSPLWLPIAGVVAILGCVALAVIIVEMLGL